MSDDPNERMARTPDEQQAYSEAKERERRLQTWLDGMLAGGPVHANAIKEWRQGLARHDGSRETSTGDNEDTPVATARPLEDSLMDIRHRIRERRELGGKPPDAEECERRSAQMIELIQTERAKGNEPTPMHLVLAARYVEGEIDFEEYSIAARSM
jgi:hypothetical protein